MVDHTAVRIVVRVPVPASVAIVKTQWPHEGQSNGPIELAVTVGAPKRQNTSWMTARATVSVVWLGRAIHSGHLVK